MAKSQALLDRAEAEAKVAQGWYVEGFKCPRCDTDNNIQNDGLFSIYACCFKLCKGCNTPALIAEEVCDNCSHCDTCCECETCGSCDKRFTTLCGNCDYCCDTCCLCCKCEGCGDKFDSLCDNCSECDSCCDCYTCDYCENKFTETTSVGNAEYCEHCLDRHCSYCEQCEEYYFEDDADEHVHDCTCDAPNFDFKFPNNGDGTINNDEKLSVTLPKGTISEEGMWQICHLLRDYSIYFDANQLENEVGTKWQTTRGNFTRRLSSALHKRSYKLSDAAISAVGNLARQHSSDESSWTVEFTRDLNQPADYFYNDDSCWWGSYSASRCALKSWGGIGMRSFAESRYHSGSDVSGRANVSGRAWVQPLDEDLEATHDALHAHAYVIYNGYGDLEGYIAARIVAHLTGRTYKKISFSANDQYVNSNNGYLVADEDTCTNTTLVRLEYSIHDQRDAYQVRRAA